MTYSMHLATLVIHFPVVVRCRKRDQKSQKKMMGRLANFENRCIVRVSPKKEKNKPSDLSEIIMTDIASSIINSRCVS